MLFELALGRVDQAFGIILRLGRLAALLVLFGELFGVLDHLVDVRIVQAAAGLDLDLLFLAGALRSEEHTSELQSLMRISYAVFCLKKKTTKTINHRTITMTPSSTQKS